MAKRMTLPFSKMSDRQILNYFHTSKAFANEFSHHTGKNLSVCIILIRRFLFEFCDKEDFCRFVRTCFRAYKNKGDELRFYREIISFIYDETKIRREVLPVEVETFYLQPLSPYLNFLNCKVPFLLDFCINYVYLGQTVSYLKDKYKISGTDFKRIDEQYNLSDYTIQYL